jgi:hypothetical protein
MSFGLLLDVLLLMVIVFSITTFGAWWRVYRPVWKLIEVQGVEVREMYRTKDIYNLVGFALGAFISGPGTLWLVLFDPEIYRQEYFKLLTETSYKD